MAGRCRPVRRRPLRPPTRVPEGVSERLPAELRGDAARSKTTQINHSRSGVTRAAPRSLCSPPCSASSERTRITCIGYTQPVAIYAIQRKLRFAFPATIPARLVLGTVDLDERCPDRPRPIGGPQRAGHRFNLAGGIGGSIEDVFPWEAASASRCIALRSSPGLRQKFAPAVSTGFGRCA